MEINASAFKGRYYFVGYTPETGNELFATGGTDPETIRARFTDNLGWCAHCESDVFRIAGAGPNHQYMIYTSGDALTSSGEKFSLHWDGSRWIGQHETKTQGSGGEWVPGETSTSNGLRTSPKPPCTGWNSGFSLIKGCMTPVLRINVPPGAPTIFGVERSPDAQNFEEIARIAATKAGQEHKSYIHIDSNPLAGRNYYRLRLVDLTGESELSRLISVEMPEITAPYPNPAKEGVFFIDTNSLKTLRLHDMMGRNIPYSTKPLGGDIVEIHPGQQLMPGIYFIFVNGKRHKMLVE